MIAAIVQHAAAVPEGSDPSSAGEYFDYLLAYFFEQYEQQEWLFQWGAIGLAAAWLAALTLFLFGWSRFQRSQRAVGERVYPLARFNEIVERAGRVSVFQMLLYGAIVSLALWYVIRTILYGYVYERF